MARARNIKPGFFRNEYLVELPYETRLLFIGLWTIADREGRLEDRPKRIKMELFPADDLNVDTCLQQLHDAGFIHRYSLGDARYIQVLAFKKHQNPHHKEQASTIPAPDEINSDERKSEVSPGHAPDTPQASRADSLNTDSLNTDSGFPHPDASASDGAAAPDVRGPDPEPAKSPKYTAEFETFWKAYPSGHGVKKTAFDYWKKIPAAERQAVMDGLNAWKACDRWQRGFVKDAQRWLRDRMWEDEPPAAPATSWQVHNGGAADSARIVPGPRGYTPDQLRRLSDQLKEQERLRETS